MDISSAWSPAIITKWVSQLMVKVSTQDITYLLPEVQIIYFWLEPMQIEQKYYTSNGKFTDLFYWPCSWFHWYQTGRQVLFNNSVTSVDVQARVMVDLILEGGYNYVSAVHTEGRRHPGITTNNIRRHKVSALR